MNVYDREARRISAKMREDGVLPDRRRATDSRLYDHVEAIGLALAGFFGLVFLIAMIALAADFMGAL